MGSLQKSIEQNLLWNKTLVEYLIVSTDAIKEDMAVDIPAFPRNRPQSLILVWDPTACRHLRRSLKLLILYQILKLLRAAVLGMLPLSWSWTDTSRPTKFSPFTQPHYLVFRKTKRHVKDQWWIRKKQDWCNLMRLVSLFLSKILKLPSLSSSHQFTHHNPPTVPFQVICGTVTSPLWSTLFPQMQMFSLLPTSENRTKSLYKRPMEKKCKKQRN